MRYSDIQFSKFQIVKFAGCERLENYIENEKRVEDFLKLLPRFVDAKTGIIRKFGMAAHYNDEPKFFRCFAEISSTKFFSDVENNEKIVGGTSADINRALAKAFGEAIERYCLSVHRKNKMIFSDFRSLHDEAVNPEDFARPSEKQIKDNSMEFLKLSPSDKFYWVSGFDLKTKKKVLVPAQLVYVPYYYDKEKMIRETITTGAASGTSLAAALRRGILEIVERDAFMITYLNSLDVPKIKYVGKDNLILKMFEQFERYFLKIILFDITLDIKLPAVLALLIDESEKGPSVSLGLKSSLNYTESIIGAMEEAQQTRPWIRELFLERSEELKKVNKDGSNLMSLEQRGIFWYEKEMISHLDFLLKSRREKIIDDETVNFTTDFDKLNEVVKRLNDLDVFYADVTTPEIKEEGVYVVKVIMPELQPLHIAEMLKCLGGKRIYSVPCALAYRKTALKEEEFVTIPHPFL